MKNNLVAVALGVSLAFLAVQPAASIDFQPWLGRDPANLVWKQGDFDYVGLQPAETPVPNAQPQRIPAEQLLQLLQSVQVKESNGDVVALFTAAEAERLALALSQALSRADAHQDIVFFSSERRGIVLLSPRLGVAARAFRSQDAINLIVGAGRLEFFDRYRGSGVMPVFSYGSRMKPAPTDLQAEGASYPGGPDRRDWLAWRVAQAQAQPQKPTSTATPPPAAPAEHAAPVQRDERFYDLQEERLRRIKRMREQGLITEEEYQQKKKEILNDL